jgi:hypothetical protein
MSTGVGIPAAKTEMNPSVDGFDSLTEIVHAGVFQCEGLVDFVYV